VNKKITSIIICISSFCFAGSALGQSITNPIKYNDFSSLLMGIASAIGPLIASLGSVMIIVAGILYLTSAGSPEKVGTAKKALVYAIAGIAIGLAASSIVQIVKGIVGA